MSSSPVYIKFHHARIHLSKSLLVETVHLSGQAQYGPNIGAGLLKGLENLGNAPTGGRIFIVVEGTQISGGGGGSGSGGSGSGGGWMGPDHPSILQRLDKAGVIVDVLAMTTHADKRLRALADRYAGRFFFASESPTANALNDAMLRDPCGDGGSGSGTGGGSGSGSGNGSGNVVSLASHAGKLDQPGSMDSGYFFIDEGIGSDTKGLCVRVSL